MNTKIKNILLNAKNIAIVGLSPNPIKDSNAVAMYLQSMNYNVIPIYPKEDFILDSKVYRSLSEAIIDFNKKGLNIDIVVMFRKSEYALNITNEIIDLKSKNIPTVKLFWMQFDIRNPEAREILEQNGIEVVEDKCIKIEHCKIK